MKKIIKLALTDFRIIFRDPSLRTFFVFPFLLFGFVVWGVPALIEEYDFLTPYLPVFLIIGVIENTLMFCFISSMVLIDEKETGVAKVYGVVPLTKSEYISSRFLIPCLITVLLNIILLVVQPFYSISWGANLTISFLSAFIVPVYVLAINAIVQNRMQGLVYAKAFNVLVLIPITAFFVPEKIKHVFGIFPTHWIFQSISNVTDGRPIIGVSITGFLFMGGLMWMMSKQFLRKHFF